MLVEFFGYKMSNKAAEVLVSLPYSRAHEYAASRAIRTQLNCAAAR
jgi:hypothetical protein